MNFHLVCSKCGQLLMADWSGYAAQTGPPSIRVSPCDCQTKIQTMAPCRVIEVFPPLRTTVSVDARDVPKILEAHKLMTFGFYKMSGEYREIEGTYMSYNEDTQRMYIWDDEVRHIKSFYLNRLEQVFVGNTLLNVVM